MAAVVSCASAKGGCSKTTLSLGIGATLALDGHKVVLLDCDTNQHASRFARKAEIPGFSVIAEVGEDTILKAIRDAANEGADLVLIDLPGGTSRIELKAMQRSHLIIVPSQLTSMDAIDAMRTLAQADDAEELSGRRIARAVVWSRVMSGFESRAAREVRQSIESMDLPPAIFRAALMNRTAFQTMTAEGLHPIQFTTR